MSKHDSEFDKLLSDYKRLRTSVLAQAQVIAVNFFKASFRNQGFTDTTLTPWKKRIPGTPNDSGRGLLISRGNLRRSIVKKTVTGSRAIVGIDSAFIKRAEIHNNGGTIPITRKMRRFFWAMYYQHHKASKENDDVHFSKFTPAMEKRADKLSDIATFWRNLALTKKTEITIPKRQFIGDSKALENQLTILISAEIDKIFKP